MMQLKGGLHVGPDGLIRTVFTHDPSTLRLASKAPALMNLPREGVVRNIFVAPPSFTFWACDFAGIENIIVGWLAGSERYIRLSKLDMHSFYTAYALYELDKAVAFEDLPQESWSDDQIRAATKAIKARFPAERQANKRHIHGGNYMEGPGMVQEQLLKELGTLAPLKRIKRLQSFYFELFPEIRTWQRQVLGLEGVGGMSFKGVPLIWDDTPPWLNAQKGYLRTPFGNIHRYYDVLTHVKGPKGWELRPSTDAKRAVAFVPQSSARFVLTRAAQRLAQDVQDTLRLFIHDEMLGLCNQLRLVRCVQEAIAQMTLPVPELNGLTFPVEAKAGPVWGEMKPV